jgi:hypothetical protein
MNKNFQTMANDERIEYLQNILNLGLAVNIPAYLLVDVLSKLQYLEFVVIPLDDNEFRVYQVYQVYQK